MRSATATERLGAKGTSIRKMFDGRCVKTMVRMSPIRRARGTAAMNDTAAHTLVQNRISAVVATDNANAWKSQRASRDCTKKPPPERVHAEERREAIDDTTRGTKR